MKNGYGWVTKINVFSIVLNSFMSLIEDAIVLLQICETKQWEMGGGTVTVVSTGNYCSDMSIDSLFSSGVWVNHISTRYMYTVYPNVSSFAQEYVV